MPNKGILIAAGLILLTTGALADGKQPAPAAGLGEKQPGLDIFTDKAPAYSYIGQVVPSSAQTDKWDVVLRTRQDYPCSNAHVNAFSVVNGDHVTIHIDKVKPVIQPNICLTALGPATYSLSLPAFDKPLTLDIIEGRNKDRYSISINSHGASVNTLRAGFTFFLQGDKPTK